MPKPKPAGYTVLARIRLHFIFIPYYAPVLYYTYSQNGAIARCRWSVAPATPHACTANAGHASPDASIAATTLG